MANNYQQTITIKNQEMLNNVLATLPSFCITFFRGIEPHTSSRTRIAYGYDLRLFFEFLVEKIPYFSNKSINSIIVDDLDQIRATDIELFLEHLKLYKKDGKQITNDERGRHRKIAAIRTLYNYFFKKEMIKSNPAALITMPKLHDKAIIRLDIDEVASLLDNIEDGTNLTKKQLEYHEKTKIRDLALMTLLLGTGIRVSECVGLDINDIDFKNNGIKITRKGGAEVIVYFGDEVHDALLAYLEERKKIIPNSDNTDALFLSLQNKRISVRSVEKLVKKYAQTVTSVKKITPHKLRSTYGTNLYQETGDIYLVADVLGHKDVNTTRRHYAAIDDSMRRKAADVVTLREKKDDM